MAHQEILDFMETNKIKIAAKFVPWSQSRSKGDVFENDYIVKSKRRPRYSLNWQVSLLVGADERHALTTDYTAGGGHCPANKSKPKSVEPSSLSFVEAIKHECETGRAVQWRSDCTFYASSTAIECDLVSVFASMIMDTDVLEAGSFEEWAADFGYDTDSRKAETTYNDCLKSALKIRAALGADKLRAAREVCADF
jgi:hypothetical protein